MKTMFIVSLLLITSIGCNHVNLSSIVFENKSGNEIEVNVRGVVPDPSPGFLAPGGVKTYEMRGSFGIGKVLNITWTEANNTKTKKLEDVSIHNKAFGGYTLVFRYKKDGQWETEWCKYRR